jgi:type II secretory pathway pseudopilin PulG
MTAMAVPRRAFRRPSVSRRFLFGSLAGVVVVGLAAVAVQQLRSPTPDAARLSAERSALARYQAAIDPLARDGGRVVAQGLKLGVTDIGQSRFTDEELVTMAAGWVHELEGVRDSFAKTPAPVFLADAKWHYDHALTEYVTTAKTLGAAAQAHGDQRASLVALAVSLGEESDAVWNRARGIVQREERRLERRGRG